MIQRRQASGSELANYHFKLDGAIFAEMMGKDDCGRACNEEIREMNLVLLEAGTLLYCMSAQLNLEIKTLQETVRRKGFAS